MSKNDYPQVWETFFGNFSDETTHSIEENAHEIATVRYGSTEEDKRPLPYLVEYLIAPGQVENHFEIRKNSCFMARTIVFESEEQKNEYLKSKQPNPEKL